MESRSPFGIRPEDLEAELAAQRARHRTQVDLLKSRLSEVSAKAAQLRAVRDGHLARLNQLEAASQTLLEELDQANAEVEARRDALVERHQLELADRSQAVDLLRQELANWIELERQIATGVLAAVEPFLQLNSLWRKQEGGKEGGR